jgi:hypothetical protein
VIEGKLMISINSDKAQRTPMLQRAILHHPSQSGSSTEASGCRIFKKFDFLVDMGSFNIQTTKGRRIFQFPKIISRISVGSHE